MVRRRARENAVLTDVKDFVDAVKLAETSSFSDNGLMPLPTKVQEAVQSYAELKLTIARAQGGRKTASCIAARRGGDAAPRPKQQQQAAQQRQRRRGLGEPAGWKESSGTFLASAASTDSGCGPHPERHKFLRPTDRKTCRRWETQQRGENTALTRRLLLLWQSTSSSLPKYRFGFHKKINDVFFGGGGGSSSCLLVLRGTPAPTPREPLNLNPPHERTSLVVSTPAGAR